MPQEAVSANIIPNSAVGLFPQKQKEQRTKQLGYWYVGNHAHLEA